MQRDNKVLFNKIPFTGSFEQYLGQIKREQRTGYLPSRSQSIESLLNRVESVARLATEPHDYVGLALHGEFDHEHDRPYDHVLFSGGGYAQQMNRWQLYRSISAKLSSAKFGGNFVLISCYQDWHPHYDSSGRLERSDSEQFTETFTILSPTTEPSAEEFATNPNADPCILSFDPFKLIHIVGDEQ